MIRRLLLGAVMVAGLAVLTLVGLAVTGISPVSATWRYRITVTVDTPEGLRSGSAVRELSNMERLFYWPEGGNPADIRGEAVVVDLGARGLLFALISDISEDEFYQAFPVPDGHGATTTEGIRYYKSLGTGQRAALDPDRYPGYPRMVTFDDLSDPMSVRLVYGIPHHTRTDLDTRVNDFEDVFGAGVQLQGAVVETTDDPVTWRMRDILPWLDKYYSRMFDGNRFHSYVTDTPVASSLSSGAFSTKGPSND
ncbi:hypothetical protein [Roseospira goensis]|uniref:Uncharacterized protein n=1 Tax=Roseospira goensis TaxID=391922 RepID=A0A7W6WM81_9PROT|nr:hypothetical protein [Roseospira goensis]MBB4287222.1 hypothetical protein [Roseospira goensis]